MPRTSLLLVPLLLTGCLRGCGSSLIPPNAPAPGADERAPEIMKQSESSAASSIPSEEQTSSVFTESSSAPEPWKPKELTPEEKKFVTDVDVWMDQMRFIVSRIRKLYSEARGLPVDIGEDVDLKKKYAELHGATQSLSIPDEYAEALVLSNKFDQTIGEAVALLSSSPTLEELEKASALINTLIPHMNKLNGLLHDIHY